MDNDNKKVKKFLTIMIVIIIILLLLYFLIHKFGYIEHHGLQVPTGNVDIFEIECNCNNCKSETKPSSNEDDINKNKSDNANISVFDDYKIWDNKELRIFTNPAYEYENIIAPGSANSYTFVIRNNNDFDIIVDVDFIEENLKNINMQYKLKSYGKYLIGNKNDYFRFTNYKLEQVKIPAKSQVPYVLDWKWIDDDLDAFVGFDTSSNYKLSIQISANEDL